MILKEMRRILWEPVVILFVLSLAAMGLIFSAKLWAMDIVDYQWELTPVKAPNALYFPLVITGCTLWFIGLAQLMWRELRRKEDC